MDNFTALKYHKEDPIDVKILLHYTLDHATQRNDLVVGLISSSE